MKMNKIQFMRYAGNKLKFAPVINKNINKSNKSIYIEPFVGGGSILFNLEKEFDKYIINDIDPILIQIYRTFKYSNYKLYERVLNYVNTVFGDIKKDKEAYYNFRNNTNELFYDTIKNIKNEHK